MVMALDERLVTVTGIVTGEPLMGWGSNDTASGDQLSEGFVLSPSPLNVTAAVSPVILAVSIPSLAPNAVGVKVTGTEMLWPVESDAGSEEVGVPMLYAPPATAKDETVVGALAVKVSLSVVD
jgi:hypothetical protein